MKKIILISILISITTTGAYASSASFSGYTYFTVSACDSKVKKKYGSYCTIIVSNIIHISNCKNPGSFGGCGAWDYSKYVHKNISDVFSITDGQLGIVPSSDKSEVERVRRRYMRERKSNNALVKTITWHR